VQWETADFASVPPSAELDETCVLSLILVYILHNMKTTSSTKPEIHNVSHYRQKRVTCTVNLVKLGRVVFEIRKQTDKQTVIQTH